MMKLNKGGALFATLIASLFVFAFSGPSNDRKVCYGDLGCFSTNSPWSSLMRPVLPPWPPGRVKTRFFFFSRSNVKQRKEILLRPTVDLNGLPFDKNLSTAFIVHGFVCNSNLPWITHIKDAYLSSVPSNVFLVDWGPGSMIPNYFQASGNARVVGAEIARVIKELKINPKKVHLIGHSLGAQIASYAGKLIEGIGRLTALDPAQPLFEGCDRAVRLDSGDADFVEVLHTDARPFSLNMGMGMMDSVGHVDFYFNGGFDQPGCFLPQPSMVTPLTKAIETISNNVASCSHTRAIDYFVESLNNTASCVFRGLKTSIGRNLRSLTKLTPLSPSCSEEDCVPLSLSSELTDVRGSFVVSTNSRKPFCVMEEVVPAMTVLD